jgi:hypothetical protein
MLAMRLPPPGQPGEAAALTGDVHQSQVLPGSPEQGPAAAGGTQEQQAAQGQPPPQPFVLLMDVNARAPNIRLPRNSGEAATHR